MMETGELMLYLPSGYIISSDRQNGLFIFESPLTNDSMEWSQCFGDLNYDGVINILDIVALANCVLAANCLDSADINSDGEYNIIDIVTLVNLVLFTDL